MQKLPFVLSARGGPFRGGSEAHGVEERYGNYICFLPRNTVVADPREQFTSRDFFWPFHCLLLIFNAMKLPPFQHSLSGGAHFPLPAFYALPKLLTVHKYQTILDRDPVNVCFSSLPE